MDTAESSAPHAHLSTNDHDDTVEAYYASLERPCACNDGWVTIGQIAVDPARGEEVEEYALYLCCRCADSRWPRSCVAKPACADLRREWGTPPESPPCPSRLLSSPMQALV